MAKVIVEQNQTQPITGGYRWWIVAIVGGLLGLMYIGLTFLISHYIIDPLNCHIAVNSTTCLGSWSISGNIATILIGVVGTGILVKLRVGRPLQIALASAVLLWGLADLTNGLSVWETTLWTTLLYALAYILFSWIARWNRMMPTVASSIIIVLVARIVLAS